VDAEKLGGLLLVPFRFLQYFPDVMDYNISKGYGRSSSRTFLTDRVAEFGRQVLG